MSEPIQKVFLGLITLGVCCISIQLVPVSRKAIFWNRCWEVHKEFLSKVPALQGKSDEGLDAMSVAMCNGAVYESKRTKKR